VVIGPSAADAITTGSNNIVLGNFALGGATAMVNNICMGDNSLSGNQTTAGSDNISIGRNSCFGNWTGAASNNIAIGQATLQGVLTGTSLNNIAIGQNSLIAVTSGATNVALGNSTGATLTTGSNNIIIGSTANVNDAARTNTVVIGVGTTTTADNQIRIGPATTAYTSCFIQGIRGITTGVADAVTVLVDSAHQLGTVSSSMRYKENIQPMGDFSSRLSTLKPVMFNWKEEHNPSRVLQYGLIAEDVAKTFPELAIMKEAENGEVVPETVAYHGLPVIILSEHLKLYNAHLKLHNAHSKLQDEHLKLVERITQVEKLIHKLSL
jgi:hypothetical protein